MASITAEKIAGLTSGRVVGESDATIHSVAKLEEAGADDLCFFANPKYEEALYDCKAGIIIVPIGFEPARPLKATRIEHANPYFAFCLVLNEYFNPNVHPSDRDPDCYVHESAQVGENCYIGRFSYVSEDAVLGNNSKIYPQVFVGKGAKIGEGTVLYPGVKLYAGCLIGKNCIIHAGTVIGSDGFGFAPVGDIYAKIPQIGNVIIEDDVELGSNCSVDRATMGSTIIRQGCKLDNLIQVAHNAEIGRNTVIAAQAGISGSTRIGDNCQIGGQTGFVGHIQIANRVGIGAQAGVSKAIEEEGSHWIGSPAMPLKEFFRSQAVFRNLALLQQRVNELEKQLKQTKT